MRLFLERKKPSKLAVMAAFALPLFSSLVFGPLVGFGIAIGEATYYTSRFATYSPPKEAENYVPANS